MDWEVFLVIQSDAAWLAADSLVGQGVEQVDPFVHDDLVLDVRIIFILDLELILGHLLNGEAGRANGALLRQNVARLRDVPRHYEVNIGFVCFHRYFKKMIMIRIYHSYYI